MGSENKQDIILKYKGPLDYDKIGDLISTLKRTMKKRGMAISLYKKLLTLMIESLENIVRYSASYLPHRDTYKKYQPEICICLENDSYIFRVVNLMENADIVPLQQKMDELNNLDQDQLKALYKNTITNGKFSDKGGAGLGIIEMAKISDEKLHYTFSAFNAEQSEFQLLLRIYPNKVEE